MDIESVINMIESKEYEYFIVKYQSETDFLKHIYKFPDLKDSSDCSVKALVLPCKNKHKNIELQFNEINGEYVFVEMLFGDFCFEMYDCPEEILLNEIMRVIYQVFSDLIAIIVQNDIKNKKWIGDDCYYLIEDDPVFGEPGFFNALSRIQRPQNPFEKMFSNKREYEIYSYSSYQSIIK
ncbi:MAG: hypothetical protein IKN26_07340 [Eubacterium sp.]|nr:hypothetical protein [Eubacterium sp.]